MNEVTRDSEIDRISKEVGENRMTLDEAAAAIAQRFGVTESEAIDRDRMIWMALDSAWDDCERERRMNMDDADVAKSLIDAVKSGDMMQVRPEPVL